jgi:predicted Zn-dependent peptidase
LNRKTAPPIHEVRHLALPKPELLRLDNGVPVHVLHFPGQEILKLEVVFRAGRPEEEKRAVARATARLLREGTLRRSGADIAETIDFYGGSLSVPTNLDAAIFGLFSLKKHAPALISVFAELLQEPAFPEAELDTFRRTNAQEMRIELEKVEVLAYREITERMFGAAHPYGYNSVPADYDALSRADLQHFFTRWYTPANCQVFASGHVDDDVLRLLNQQLGQRPMQGEVPDFQSVVPETKPRKILLPRPASLQVAIRVGRRLFNKQHPDFNGLFVLNTILGGYFGSRLMMNIREKKGYTYNIYSTLDAMLHDGCLYIATEVNKDKADATLRAIRLEMKKLCEKPVPDAELDMVRNYLLGMLLNGLDGPLNSSDIVRGIIVEQLPWDSFDALVREIRDISAERLQALAQRYLDPADYWTVLAGVD